MKHHIIVLTIILSFVCRTFGQPVLPGKAWATQKPSEMGLEKSILKKIPNYLGGRGFIARDGYQVFTWGDFKKRGMWRPPQNRSTRSFYLKRWNKIRFPA
ncbi:hypothetical protein GF373_12990 [bacterium]|nr:hypothetical protein [bacterium]